MNRVAFFLDRFELQSPGQQLLDRFLIGYKQNGKFKPAPWKVILSLPQGEKNSLIQSRRKEFGLEVADSLEEAVNSADAVLLAPGTRKYEDTGFSRLDQVLAAVTPKQRLFVDGSLLQTGKINTPTSIFVSRAASHLFPLPVKPMFRSAEVQRSVIVVQGVFPEAELDALFAIKPYLDTSWPQSAPSVQPLKQGNLWDLMYSSDWRPLLEAAISRSDNIKGDPEKDGRTQDIVGLQLIEKLAPKARGWHLQHEGGIEMVILVGDGALSDFNFAVEANGRIHSAQLCHGQSPMENHYDEMAGWIIERFANETAGSNVREALLISATVSAMNPLAAKS